MRHYSFLLFGCLLHTHSMCVSGISWERTETQGKIVGGNFTTYGEFPYQVEILYNNKFFCGGTILSKNIILTAAHCVINLDPFRLVITAGEHIRSSWSLYGSKQIRIAERIHVHENYNDSTIVNDIAIIELSEPLQFTSYIGKISLPKAREEFSGNATATGWGITVHNGQAVEVLRKVELSIVPNFQCKNLFLPITEEMLCAGGIAGKSTCNGDSGGPLVCKRHSSQKNEGKFVVCGVTSFGPKPCAQHAGYPDVFVKVSAYINWIQRFLKEDGDGGVDIAKKKCSSSSFYCSSGPGCIPRIYICDGEPDCGESQDEKTCKDTLMRRCRSNQFRCSNGLCIQKELVCNGKDDCGDKSDEDKCPTPDKKCANGEHQCGTNGRCVPNKWKCDGQQDCDDNSDEKGCTNTKVNN